MSDQHDDETHPYFRAQRQPPATQPTPAEIRHERANIHRSIGKRMQQPKFSARTEKFLQAMIEDGLGWREAAAAAGIKTNLARYMLSSPAVHRAMAQRAESIRSTENVRNPVVAARIRDRALEEGATAAQQKVALEAMKFLEGRESAGGTTVNVTVTPGYVIDLSGPAAEPRQIEPLAPPKIIDHDEFR